MTEVFIHELLVSEVTPEMTPEWGIFAITVRWRGGDEWVATRHLRYFNAKGEWSWKNFEDEKWKAEHVFPSQGAATTAAALAAGSINVNGHVASEVAAAFRKEQADAD